MALVSADVAVRVLQEEPELGCNTVLTGLVFKLGTSPPAFLFDVADEWRFKFVLRAVMLFTSLIGVLKHILNNYFEFL